MSSDSIQNAEEKSRVYDEAIDMLQKAHEQADAINDDDLRASIQGELGTVYFKYKYQALKDATEESK